jgi:Ca2+-binding RTX toxin-like protein
LFGGNFTGAVDGLGGDGDDLFIGSGAGENFVGGRGDDALIGNGGADILNGAAGDDLLAIGDVGFRLLEGGSGFDTVRLDSAGASLDLTALPDPFVHGIEAFDLNSSGNALVLDRLEILNVAEESNALFVFGDESNAVSGDLPGATVGAATVDGVDFQTFAVGPAQLFVQTGVDAASIDTAVA